jgi:hypothetical protein
VAVDVSGNVYAIESVSGFFRENMIGFDSRRQKLFPTEAEEEANELFPYTGFKGPRITALATNFCPGSESPGNLYAAFSPGFEGRASYVNAYGAAPVGCEPVPPRPPEISAQYATSVGTEEATLKAEINPRFWQDATYQVEYGTGKCSEGGCQSKQPPSPAPLTAKAVNGPVKTADVALEGLQPGTTYHYRFLAKSSGGGPTVGEERAFRTFAAPSPPPACPANEAFRTGPSAELPDCRAYEMVSPATRRAATRRPGKGETTNCRK